MQQENALKWRPSEESVGKSAMYRFAREVEKEHGITLPDYPALWQWSVANKEAFWSKVWDFCGIIGDKKGPVFKPGAHMREGRFFPESRINFAENLLRRRDDGVAILFRTEKQQDYYLTFNELYDSVSQMQQVLREAGVKAGDRVAGYLPNMPESIVCMLATASLGAIWSSASPDFGVQGVLDRFGQIEPKVLIAADCYYYNGRVTDCLVKLKEIALSLPTLQKTIVVSFLKKEKPFLVSLVNAESYDDAIARFQPKEMTFERFPFNHPLYIMFSSGTTGAPKCIVHGAGGTLIQHLKEHQLHCDVRRDDRVLYFTTLGWMMWNWQVTALASNAAVMIYDGSPFYPDGNALFEYADKNGCTLFGASAKYFDSLKAHEYRPHDKFPMKSVRMITSTGSPLVHETFDYIYDAIHPTAHLASISGGTDIVSLFVGGCPLLPVYRGEIQCSCLGMDMDVFDEQGNHLSKGTGELVCKTPFPCMPVGFWNDPDGKKYSKAYFERFDNIWCHGDWCELTEHGGMIIHGRSDATLNPGGVRIGTAEIYRQVEKLESIKECIAVGQDWQGDVRVILFVVMKDPQKMLDADLTALIKKTIREGTSPRHVPAKIVAVADIPRTRSGKITELAVRDIIHNRPVKNVEALANPDALKLYANLKELA